VERMVRQPSGPVSTRRYALGVLRCTAESPVPGREPGLPLKARTYAAAPDGTTLQSAVEPASCGAQPSDPCR
jgi:hypothetical protein